jgi:hypothetical protein
MVSPVAKLTEPPSLRYHRLLHKNALFHLGQYHLPKSANFPAHGVTSSPLSQRFRKGVPSPRYILNLALL